jgi:cytochrome b561
MLRNTARSWGSLARRLHWTTVVLIAIQIPLGFWMVDVYEAYTVDYADDTWVMRTSRAHHTLGFIVLFLVSLRVSWRLRNPTPELPCGLAFYHRVLARSTHIFLYLLLVVYPLSGWASLSAYDGDFPIFFLGWESVPGIVPSVPEGEFFDYAFFAEVHRSCWKVGAAILGLHIIGALWHQFVVHDTVLSRMWRGND